MKPFVTILVLFLTSGVQANELHFGLNDVSFLYPLGTNSHQNNPQLLHASTLLASSHPILSVSDILKFPTPAGINLEELTTSLYPSLAAVAVRLDPCFQDLANDPCHPQIRLVLQPATDHAEDIALHLFFDLPLAELVKLVNETRNERTSLMSDGAFTQLPLTIHPLLKTNTTNSFRDHLNERLKIALGKAIMTRVAFFEASDQFHWVFASFNVDSSGQITPLTIPNLKGATSLQFSNSLVFSSDGVNEFEVIDSDLPKNESPDHLFDYLNHSFSYRHTKDIPNLIARIQRIENPDIHHSGTIDCISCHTARPVRNNLLDTKLISLSDWLKNAYANLMFPNDGRLTPNLKAQLGADTGNLRAFGYSGSDPVIAPRVVNESMKVAEWFNRN